MIGAVRSKRIQSSNLDQRAAPYLNHAPKVSFFNTMRE